MQANKQTPNSKLIADIFVPESSPAMNRRGNAMNEVRTQDPVVPPSHRQHEPTYHRKRSSLSLSAHSVLPAPLYNVKSSLPAWSPKKFTITDGVKTNWEAALPSKQTLTNSGLLASFLVIAAFAVWAMPQKNAPQVIAEKPIAKTTSGTNKGTSAPQGVLTVAAAPTSTANSSGWKLYMGRATTPNLLPTISQPSQGTSKTAGSSSSDQGGSTTAPSNPATPPPAQSETPTEPTEPTTPVVDPPADPPAEPEDPPVVIVDPPTPGLDELLGNF